MSEILFPSTTTNNNKNKKEKKSMVDALPLLAPRQKFKRNGTKYNIPTEILQSHLGSVIPVT